MVDVNVSMVPNAARVYDYMLGGEHNFQPDRDAAEYMNSLLPSTRNWVRRLRSFLHVASARLAGEGFSRFLDLASGLPTREHIHASIPDARVVYVDNDPVVVEFATQILGTSSNARYLEADIRNISAILRSPIIGEVLGGGSKIAIGFNAVTCFLTETEIAEIARALYDWAPCGSKMFATFETKLEGEMTPKLQQMLDMFDRMGSPYHFLTLAQSRNLVGPWVADTPGFRPLFDWLGTAETPREDGEGVGLEFYGAILVKP